MVLQENNYAFIDGANLHKGVEGLGWKLDYKRFRVWLKEKYSVQTAYIFIGLVAKHNDMYTYLQRCGYTLVFKETTFDGDGRVKGNCDADLVLWAVRDAFENSFDKAVLVSSDGDYSSLVKFLQEKNKIIAVLSPNNMCSILIKRTGISIVNLSTQKSTLEQKIKKPPIQTELYKGLFRSDVIIIPKTPISSIPIFRMIFQKNDNYLTFY